MSAGPRVLLVDDDDDVLDFLETLLAIEGFATARAAGAVAAFAKLTADPEIALVLVDIAMPDIDGLELCRRLKAAPATRGLPVVVLSARPGQKAEAEALSAGADDFLRKPFDNDELLRLVRERLRSA